jgi:hypothetical protein
LCISLVYVHMQ